ncbi:SAM-dependent methyltransferase [Actinoplanes sp. CA-030573]|uniref:SAM-dependent methyltransferase n=1 Tax=Actinoplanes sp. CA-030573 TaxID=3239898 RepID=UPI003D8D2999
MEETAERERQIGAFAQRVLADGTASITIVTAAIGDRLGLFRVLAESGPVTAEQLAGRAGIVERYAREWLSAMAAAGYLRYDAAGETFVLPEAHVPVLGREDTPASLGSILQWMLGVAPALDAVADAFRTGAGVRSGRYGPDLGPAIERLGAPAYVNALVPVWLPAMPAVPAALREGAAVADVGCGAGRALIELARAFPASRFAGFDLDPEQVERARQNVQAAGVDDRVRIERSPVDAGPYDLICTFDVVHDAAGPEELLRSIRSALRPGGVYLCGEIDAGAALSDNLNPLGALYYGVSLLYCLSVSLAAGGPGLGSLGLPEPVLAELCERAGFGAVRRLPVGDPFHALYEVRP